MNAVKPLSYSHDLSREEIIARFRTRIAQGKRSKLGGSELGQLILYFVERLQQLDSEAEIRALCAAEIKLLEEGYPQSTLASDYIPKYRQALLQAIEAGTLPLTAQTSHRYTHIQRVTGSETQRFEHYALTYLKYDAPTYEALDRRQVLTNRKHQLNLLSVNPERYLVKLKELLHSADKFAARHQAIALAGLTGRRIGEVLARGRFATANHPYLLRFTGQQKTQRSAYEIVTLLPAAELLVQLQHFRNRAEIQPLLQLEGEELTKALNQIDVQVNRECQKHLGSVVPALADREQISVHNLRSLWGAVVVWMFCPPHQHEYPFIQHYLGHVLESSATGHYFRYQLVDDAGQLLRDKGIRLAEVGALPLLEDEVEDTKTATPTTEAQATPNTSPRFKLSKLRYYHRDRQRWMQLLDTLCPHCHNQQEKLAALLEWAEQHLQQPESVVESSPTPESATVEESEPATESAELQPQLDPTTTAAVQLGPAVAQTIADQARTLAWLTNRIEQLEAEVSQLQQQRDQAAVQLEQLQQSRQLQPQLQQELAQLKAENSQLRQAHSRYEAVRRALLNSESAVVTPTTPPPPDSEPASPEQLSNSAPTFANARSQPIELSTPRAAAEPGSLPTAAELESRGAAGDPPTQNLPQLSAKTSDRSSSGGGAKARANRIFKAIQAWNQQHPHNTFAITLGLLENSFGINRKAAKEFYQEFQPPIQQHHQQIGVENERSHNRGKDIATLQEFVSRHL